MMLNFTQSEQPRPSRKRWRWIALVIASVVLHVFLLSWANGSFRTNLTMTPSPVVMTAALQPLAASAAIPPAAVLSSTEKPRPKPPAPRKAKAPASVVEPVAPIANNAVVVAEAAQTEPAPTVISSTESEAPAVTEIASVSPEKSPAEKTQNVTAPAPGYQVKPPPSAALSYDVHALRDGKNWYGSGEISWKIDGNDYLVTGEASVSALMFKITALNFSSKGSIDEFGVAPLLYSETRFRKSATNTHFRHDPDIISFSASTTTYPRMPGAQDRASIMWQLSAIGNGDPAQFVPGAEIELFVAGVRDAEPWRIKVINEERIEVGTGSLAAWHVSRAPRAGSYEQKIDIWLAPKQNWYPVRILYTELNGDMLNMSLSKLDGASTIKEQQ